MLESTDDQPQSSDESGSWRLAAIVGGGVGLVSAVVGLLVSKGIRAIFEEIVSYPALGMLVVGTLLAVGSVCYATVRLTRSLNRGILGIVSGVVAAVIVATAYHQGAPEVFPPDGRQTTPNAIGSTIVYFAMLLHTLFVALCTAVLSAVAETVVR